MDAEIHLHDFINLFSSVEENIITSKPVYNKVLKMNFSEVNGGFLSVIEYITLGIGIVFLIYFALRTAIVKPAKLKFSAVWLYAGLISIGAAALCLISGSRVLFFFCLIEIILSACAVAGMITIDFIARSERRKTCKYIPEYIIIAGVYYPSDEFFARVNGGLDFWKKHPESEIICTGAKIGSQPMSQAEAMREYLLRAGVPEEKIHIENKSLSTADNLRNSHEITGNKNRGIVAVTSDYHAARIKLLGRKTGFAGLRVLPVPFKGISWPNYALRELYLILKMLISL